MSGCSGQIGDPIPPTSGPSVPALCSSIDVAPTPLRRLTASEYAHTVRDLFAVDVDVTSFDPPDHVGAFEFNIHSSVDAGRVRQYMLAAEDVAARALARHGVASSCGTSDFACLEAWIRVQGKRVFRRPLSASEVAAFRGLAEGSGNTGNGERLVLEAMLQSPQFLYLMEDHEGSADGESRPLSSHELATRLSYFLWGSTPDDELLAAADADALASDAQLDEQIRRLLRDPRADAHIMEFYLHWLGLISGEEHVGLEEVRKDVDAYPTYTDFLRDSMLEETETFIANLLSPTGSGSFIELLSADYSFVNDALATHYGLTPPTAPFQRVATDPNKHKGILTHASVLTVFGSTSQSAPVHRGVFVLDRFLCADPPPPPPSVNASEPAPDPNLTRRQEFEQHRNDPACAACHSSIDPIGFGFENYDGIGRHRTLDDGLPVDASGEVVIDDTLVTFDGAVELAGVLAESEQVRSCFVKQWYRYASGRMETSADDCALRALERQFAESGYDIRELAVQVALSPAFRIRRSVENNP